jgi:hypothetical protein
VAVLAVAAALLVFVGSVLRPAVAASAAGAALAAVLLVPGIASIATAAEPHTGALPTAAPQASVRPNGGFGPGGGQFGRGNRGNPFGNGTAPGTGNGGFPGAGGGTFPGFGGGGGFRGGGIGGLLDAQPAAADLVAALQADAASYTWTAATTGSNNAAGLALSSQTSILAIGGFNGSDPAPTLEQFQSDVAAGRIHYYVGTRDAAGFRGTQGGSDVAAEIAAWVQANFSPQTIGGVTLYDLTA